MFGKIIIYLSAFSWLFSFLFFLFYHKSRESKIFNFARSAYFIGISTIIIASIFLLYNILSHNFHLSYVWSYSSKKLPFYLLLSSFYAGQEGSFLLWSLWLSIIGIVFYFFASKRNLIGLPLSFFSFILLFISIILIFKSPFTNIWEAFPESNIPRDFVPPDGRGLNPVLENYWIAIHPPILFFGYSLLTIPFVLAISGWIEKKYEEWVNYSTVWALFGAGILGLGIMLGGFWAYETLGWGGYWGWDPVENSSLVPWLFITSFVHTAILQRANKGLIRTNYIIASLSFLSVLYATYLTRSGVLSETSVHSFVDPGKLVNALLIIFIGLIFLISLVVFFSNLNNSKRPRSNFPFMSRDFFIVLGSLVLIFASFIIILGTSLPIFQGWVGLKKVALDPGFYNQWMLPIAILILLLNGLSIILNSKQKEYKSLFKNYFYDFVVSIVLSIIFTIFLTYNFAYGVLIFSSVFSISTNVRKIWVKIKKRSFRIGAFISHLGIAFLIVGSITSGGFEKTEIIHLYEGKSTEAFGYSFEFLTREQIEKHLSDREKYLYHIKISNENYSSIAKPVVYWSEFNDFQQPFFEPDIKTFFNKDLYISPKSISFHDLFQPIKLKKGENLVSPWSVNDSITFLNYDMSAMNVKGSSDHFLFGLVLNFKIDGQNIIDTIFSILNMKINSFSPVWKRVPHKNFSIGFKEFQPAPNLAESNVILGFGREMFTADVTIKPFILLVWIGVVFIVVGFIIAVGKYINKQKERIY